MSFINKIFQRQKKNGNELDDNYKMSDSWIAKDVSTKWLVAGFNLWRGKNPWLIRYGQQILVYDGTSIKGFSIISGELIWQLDDLEKLWKQHVIVGDTLITINMKEDDQIQVSLIYLNKKKILKKIKSINIKFEEKEKILLNENMLYYGIKPNGIGSLNVINGHRYSNIQFVNENKVYHQMNDLYIKENNIYSLGIHHNISKSRWSMDDDYEYKNVNYKYILKVYDKNNIEGNRPIKEYFIGFIPDSDHINDMIGECFLVDKKYLYLIRKNDVLKINITKCEVLSKIEYSSSKKSKLPSYSSGSDALLAGNMLIVLKNNKIYAHDLNSMEILWNINAGSGTLTAVNDSLFYPMGKKLVASALNDGNIIFEKDFSSEILDYIIINNGVIVLTANELQFVYTS